MMYWLRHKRLPRGLNRSQARTQVLKLLHPDHGENLEPTTGSAQGELTTEGQAEGLRQIVTDEKPRGINHGGAANTDNGTNESTEDAEHTRSKIDDDGGSVHMVIRDQEDTPRIQQLATIRRMPALNPLKRSMDATKGDGDEIRDQRQECNDNSTEGGESLTKRICAINSTSWNNDDDRIETSQESSIERVADALEDVTGPSVATALASVQPRGIEYATETALTSTGGSVASNKKKTEVYATLKTIDHQPCAASSPAKPGACENPTGLCGSAESVANRDQGITEGPASMPLGAPNSPAMIAAGAHGMDDADHKQLGETEADFEGIAQSSSRFYLIQNVTLHEEQLRKLQTKLTDLETRYSSSKRQLELAQLALGDAQKELTRSEFLQSEFEKISPSIETFAKEYFKNVPADVPSYALGEQCFDCVDELSRQLKVVRGSVIHNRNARDFALARVKRYQKEVETTAPEIEPTKRLLEKGQLAVEFAKTRQSVVRGMRHLSGISKRMLAAMSK